MTGIRNRAGFMALVLVVLAGCSGQRARAPVDMRVTEREPDARVFSRYGSRAGTADAGATGTTEQYTVKRGDTLYSIAWQQGLDVQQLARLNRIRSPYTIYVGQRLVIRAGGAEAAAPLPRREPLETRPIPAPAAPSATATARTPGPVAKPPPAPNAPPSPASVPASVANIPDYDGKWVQPAKGRVLRGFQQEGNGKKGIDIGGEAGQPVVAAANGKVVYVGSGLVGYGRLIIIKHNDSLLSAYGHNSELLVAEGDPVRAGQTIAKMGSSGTNRTMLYFEIRKDGKPVDPAQYLPRLTGGR